MGSDVRKRRLVEIPDEVWDRVVVRAAEEKRAVKEVVTNALRLYLGRASEPLRAEVEAREPVSDPYRSRAEEVLASLKTGRQLAEEREGRRGDESGSQDWVGEHDETEPVEDPT